MSDIKTYELKDYVPGKTSFEVSLGDIFVVPNNETLKSIDYVSISNNGIIQCKKEGSGTNTKFIFTPTSNIKEPNHKYDVTVKFTLTTEISSDDNTISVKTRNCFIKLILTPEINDTTSRLYIVNYMGKLSPDEYMKEHSDKDDLSSLVTKKALITNLKEFGKQVQNKVSNVQVFAIRYDLDGGSWNNGNEGRTSFVNSISYVAPAPVKTGYTFNGWKLFKINDDKETATALNNGNITTDSMIPVGTSFDVLCVADWVRIAYELKLYDAANIVYFNPKDVDYSKNPKLKDITIVENNGDGNSKTISLVTPEKAGYTFKYWTTTNKYGQIITCKNDQNINEVYDQVFEASNDTDARIIELTPYFEARVYTLNYNLSSDNATLDDSLTDSSKNNEYVYGTTFTLPIPRRNGYKFDGWTIGSLVNQFVINPTDLEKITTSTVEVKASWTAATFHLDFDLQNGSIANNSNYTLKANTPIALSNPTRPGYTFDSWKYDSADGSITLDNTTKKYTFTPSDTVDHDITLTAIWKASEETEYTLQIWEETLDSTGTFTADNDTCVYRLTESISKTGKTGADTGFTSSNLAASSGYSIPAGFELSKIENVSIKADGTSICKIYIHRKACTITIIDKYDITSSSSFTDRTYTSLYRTDINNIGTATTSNKISGKFGQTLIAYPIFNDIYPELNYTCNTSGKSLVFNTTSQTVTFTYTKKNVRVTFDLNNVGTWTIGDTKFNSDIYSIDIPYGAILDNSHIPNVINHNAVSSSKWVVESTEANEEISNIAQQKFTKDTKIRRIPTFYNNKIIISTENYDEANFSITNVINSTYYTISSNTNYLSTSIRPIELLTPAFDAYNFIGYKYKFGANSSFSDRYISSINKDIWTSTSANNDLYIMACFERRDPSLDLSDIKVTYESETLTVQSVSLKNGATKFYISSTVPNANVNTNLGNGSRSGTDGKHSASISGSFAIDNSHNTIVLIPSKEVGTVKIAGKPFIGTISKIDDTKATVSWIQSYQVYDNQDDAYISGITATNAGTHTSVTDKTSIIASTNAEKVLINKSGALSIAIVSNNGISIPIDNYSLSNAEGTDLRNKVSNEIIQLTPIKHDKTGKSAILDIKKESTLIKKTEPNIIAFEDSIDYYNISDYTRVSDTLGLNSNGSYNTSLYVTSGSINIPNLVSTAPNTNKNKKLNSITYVVNTDSNYISGDTVVEDSPIDNLGINLYASINSPTALNNLFYTTNVPSNLDYIDGNTYCTNKLISLSNVAINLAEVNDTYNKQVDIRILCKSLTYHSSPVTADNASSAYYSVDADLKVITLSSQSISTQFISASDIIKCAEDKYFKITLGNNFYTADDMGNLTKCTEAYVKCSDLTIAGTTLGNTVSQAATNICAVPTVSIDTTAINSTNSASFIKKGGGTGSLTINIPITVYNSITYNLLSTVGNKLRAYFSSNNSLPVEEFTENNIIIRSGDITSNNTNNSYIQWSSITLESNKPIVTYKYANVRRDYESYLTTIEGQYL